MKGFWETFAGTLPLGMVLLLAAGGVAVSAQTSSSSASGTVERVKVHGQGLEGNLEGDSPDRDVSVYLPPSYKTHPERRYPVVYFLHGFTDSDAQWYGFRKHWINLPEVINKALASGASREMIVVTPNAYTRFAGSMYSNSATTGDWEDFVAKELVSYIDQHYRTLPQAASRGLAGHSMGGYGSIRIGMKHPEVFSSVYLLSPCCMAPNWTSRSDSQFESRLLAVRTQEQFEKADFFTKATFASAAAWSPDPKNPPFYLDLPVGDKKDTVQTKWTANAPLAMLDQYINRIRKLHAFAFDAGDRDTQIAGTVKQLDQDLNRYGIAHGFEIYPGTHVSRIAERIETRMLPFFSYNLVFPNGKR